MKRAPRYGERVRITGRVQVKPDANSGEKGGEELRGEEGVVHGRNAHYVDQSTGEPCTVVTFGSGAICGVPDKALSPARKSFFFGR